MTSNKELINQSVNALSGKWLLAVGTMLVYLILTGSLQAIPKIGPIIGLVTSGPFALGLILFFKNMADNREARLEQIFDGFKNFGTALATYLLSSVAAIVGLVFLIVPGIIIGIGLAQSMYIISDDEEIGAYDALSKSWDMMDGFKMKYFGLLLIFFLLSLLCILTLGIGFLWLIPIFQVTAIKFYEEVKTDYELRNPKADSSLDTVR